MILINLNDYPINCVLEKLLKDKTTKKNIIFATNSYSEVHPEIEEKTEITCDLLNELSSFELQPRVSKTAYEQSRRTRQKAEVFTPSWICNKMNNHCDEEWFGRPNVFNCELENGWETNLEKVVFNKENGWKKYVDSKRLEITCGEAPYIVSRYDTTTGEIIPIKDRIGILDRKLRVVGENTETEEEWLKWAIRAFQSCYGYEFQGDNLLIARCNFVLTFCEYIQDRWEREPSKKELSKIANIVVWNLWQMDGITGTIPFRKAMIETEQIDYFNLIVGNKEEDDEPINCKIFDWRGNNSIEYRRIGE